MATPGVSLSLVPHEFLFPNSTVTLRCRAAVDRRGKNVAVGVTGVPGRVRISRDGRRLDWTPGRTFSPGPTEFVVESVVSRSGSKLSDRLSIPVNLVRSRSPIPGNVVVEGFSRLRVSSLNLTRLPTFGPARGKYVEVMKAVRRRGGRPIRLAFDHRGNPVDFEALQQSIMEARAKRYGKLQPLLHHRLRKKTADQREEVAIWMAHDESLFDDQREMKEEKGIGEGRIRLQMEAVAEGVAMGRELLRELGVRRFRVDPVAPVVFARLRKRDIKRLRRDERVAGVFRYDPRGIPDLEESIEIANSDHVHSLGQKGKGVRAAVWERGPDDTSDLVIAGSYLTNPDTSGHSRHVHGIIKNKETNEPKGHAPSCSLYSGNSYDLAALRWAVADRHCTVVNQSFHRTDEATDGELSFDDIYKDWLILRPPYPTICQAAGNTGEGGAVINPATDEYVNHKGYNSLTVGNHDDDALAMAGDSVFRNPPTDHGDRELPEISANGMGVTTVGLTLGGTSMASPTVVGITALLQGENSTLKIWPEGCRAILLAGASRNVRDDSWWRDVSSGVDARDGSGAVNALESYRITENRRDRNAAATQRGWDVGCLKNEEFGSDGLSTFRYQIKVPTGPAWLWGPRHVKVALAWNSKVRTFWGIIPISSKLTVDHDLKVFDEDGHQVGYSGSWDNSYEIAEFEGHPGKTYTVRIRRWSGTDSTWYGIAWTVTGGLAVLQRALRSLEFSARGLTPRRR